MKTLSLAGAALLTAFTACTPQAKNTQTSLANPEDLGHGVIVRTGTLEDVLIEGNKSPGVELFKKDAKEGRRRSKALTPEKESAALQAWIAEW
ncbi:MAG TPA: hypothetical protein VEC13_01290 [Candidatus Paceibacterota bacterium]|nr:hypothetical protein [Candidatus Paceibacterota bacterium]